MMTHEFRGMLHAAAEERKLHTIRVEVSLYLSFTQSIQSLVAESSKMLSGRRTDQKTAKKELKSNLMVLGAWFAIIRVTPYVLQAFQRKQ